MLTDNNIPIKIPWVDAAFSVTPLSYKRTETTDDCSVEVKFKCHNDGIEYTYWWLSNWNRGSAGIRLQGKNVQNETMVEVGRRLSMMYQPSLKLPT